MTDPVTGAADPDHDVAVSRDLLAQMDEAVALGLAESRGTRPPAA